MQMFILEVKFLFVKRPGEVHVHSWFTLDDLVSWNIASVFSVKTRPCHMQARTAACEFNMGDMRYSMIWGFTHQLQKTSATENLFYQTLLRDHWGSDSFPSCPPALKLSWQMSSFFLCFKNFQTSEKFCDFHISHFFFFCVCEILFF